MKTYCDSGLDYDEPAEYPDPLNDEYEPASMSESDWEEFYGEFNDCDHSLDY